jgi:SAM-dependent methyltransferase
MITPNCAWYVDFFHNDYLKIYGHLFTPARAEKEVAFVARVLELRAGSRVLDLCCGQGRHAILLAKYGFCVTGLDLNPTYLELAQKAARASDVVIKTVVADMRGIGFQDYFDAIVNMYSSFGYLESETEDTLVLESTAKATKSGGRVLFDMLNREWAVANYIQNDWHSDEDGSLYIERRDLDFVTSRMRVRFTIVTPDGRRRDSIGHDIRLYTLTEMTDRLKRVGLKVTGVFGGFDGENYGVTGRRMIVVAQKQ